MTTTSRLYLVGAASVVLAAALALCGHSWLGLWAWLFAVTWSFNVYVQRTGTRDDDRERVP